MERLISTEGGALITRAITVNGQNLIVPESGEVSVSFHKATPNQRPVGITVAEAQEISQHIGEANWTDVMKTRGETGFLKQKTSWINPLHLNSKTWNTVLDQTAAFVIHPKPNITRLNVKTWSTTNKQLKDVQINVVYEIYDDHPVIRKWVEVSNSSSEWLKIDSLTIDNIQIAANYKNSTDLTPAERGATTSLRSYQNSDQTVGVIIGSEIPSALRTIYPGGATGYTSAYFEWVVGPAEKFVSEPVFIYAYSGAVTKTISAVSTPLDRAVERPFKKFLSEIVGLKDDSAIVPTVPLWCSWSNFGPLVSDENMREMADIASRAGFRGLQLDAGWSKAENPATIGGSNSIPDPKKFPEFAKTAKYIASKGLKQGLWVSPFRNPNISPDFLAIPDAYTIPRIKRDEAYAMSFTSPWKNYYAQGLLQLHDRFGISYFKQDLTNIKFGDIAENHESRTHKESLLRGLRGLLTTLDQVNQEAPDIVLELTHEIYWGTPGVPCDLAALKSAHLYHIPPNDYSGVGPTKKRFSKDWAYNVDSLRKKLILGCQNARNRFFAHRGLPLHGLEYYAAATMNIGGSLTPEIQKRQVCSWFMGIPGVYAGDLSSLTEENIRTYRFCFDLIKGLHQKYGIYDDFQYSGVPTPTDTDWHWWGKLNNQGHGAVVVMRGDGGGDKRKINIPWVRSDKKYKVKLGFAEKQLGTYTGLALTKGTLQITLAKFSQEIVVIEPVN